MAANLYERVRRHERYRRLERVRFEFLRDRSNPLECFDDEQFRKRFRLTKPAVLYVADLIKEDVGSAVSRGPQVPVLHQLLIAVRFYATGSFQSVISDIYIVSQPTCSRIVRRVSLAIARHRKTYILFPEVRNAPGEREKFAEIGGLRGVTGVIDGTHIRIERPVIESSELYRNRKDYFSINTQIVCGADMRITSLVAYWYGSAHDSRVWENSSLFIRLQNKLAPGFLLGDSGYPCSSFLITPLPFPTSAAERNYNYAHVITRNIIERTIGVWKREFSCLRELRLKLATNLLVIQSCAVLHNIRLLWGESIEDDEDYGQPAHDGDENWTEDNYDVTRGRATAGTALRNAVVMQQFSH